MTKVLFVCIQNAGRSQMAQAFATQAGMDARSAGSNPAKQVHPKVAQAMLEMGLDVGTNVPHRLTTEDAEWADIVVTMGCGDACPYIPGKQYIDWQLDDPHGMGLEGVRAVRDQVHQYVLSLVDNRSTGDRSFS